MKTRARGFTLIELLVVMAIIIILASFLIAALWPQKDKALRSRTSAMLQAIGSALDQYYAEFHDFPPDGYDREVSWKNAGAYPAGPNPGIMLGGGGASGGTKYLYYGSGCLIYFLCYPVTNTTVIGADQGGFDPRNVRITPCNKGSAFLTTLRKEDVSTFFRDPDNFEFAVTPGSAGYGGAIGKQEWAKGEIVDAYGFPIHYDKVGGDWNGADTINFQKATFVGGTFPFKNIHSDDGYMNTQVVGHINPPDDIELNACPSGTHTNTSAPKHADPRAPAESDGCYVDNATNGSPRPRNPGGYDLWAHGKCFANGITAIGNWK